MSKYVTGCKYLHIRSGGSGDEQGGAGVVVGEEDMVEQVVLGGGVVVDEVVMGVAVVGGGVEEVVVGGLVVGGGVEYLRWDQEADSFRIYQNESKSPILEEAHQNSEQRRYVSISVRSQVDKECSGTHPIYRRQRHLRL